MAGSIRSQLIHGVQILGLAVLFLAHPSGPAQAQVPPEVQAVAWCPASKTCLTWLPASTATQYRVYRGEQASLACVVNPSLDSCLSSVYGATTTGTGALNGTPAPGRYFWYLVTAENTNGEGPSGNATLAPTPQPRVRDTFGTCPLGCVPAGQACASASDCCSSHCASGTCLAACCAPVGAACGVPADCCTNNCLGGTCQPCFALGQSCTSSSQCCSGACTGGVCVAPCQPNGGTCSAGSQCCSGICTGGLCQPCYTAGNGPCATASQCCGGAPCTTSVCGSACTPGGGACSTSSQCCSGSCAFGVCQSCIPAGGGCAANSQCCSGSCSGGVCQAACTANGGVCTTSLQCCSGNCFGGLCMTPSCSDGVKNGNETGVDCGGGTCPPCAAGQPCGVATDCSSGVCQGGICQGCASNGNSCTTSTQCCSGNCFGGLCMTPSCSDGVKNGNETGVDCGGGTCPPCANGQPCAVGTDCSSGVCQGGTCQPCAATGGACVSASQCCSGLCIGNVCTPVCGNCVVNGGEGCDDCNTVPGDGCSQTCTVEPGYVCAGSPSICTAICGDGIVAGGEACDDHNNANLDGCSATCTVEPGYVCAGSPSVCVPCAPGTADCNGNTQDGCEVNLQTSVTNCGNCGHICSLPNTVPVCVNGQCAVGPCSPGYGNCNNNPIDGCEVYLQADPANCGACGIYCALPNAASSCTNGACTLSYCLPGYADCNNNPADGCETNITSSAGNCGGCNVVCAIPNAVAGCANSACTIASCNTGYGDCNNNPLDGCETNTAANVNNCGACNNVCPPHQNSSPTCLNSQCGVSCFAGWGNCNGNVADGCETNLNSNNNCGTCGHVCPTGTSCSAGACGIPQG